VTNNKIVLTAVAIASLAFTAPAKAAGSLPERMSGVWTGSGSIHKSPKAPRERVRCRLSSKWQKSASKMAIRYICLGIDIKFETFGSLKYNPASKTISGKLTTVGIGAFKAVGKDRGSKVVLTLSGKNKKTGKPSRALLSIVLSGKNRLSSFLTATDPKSGKRFQAFKASFKK
jgi:hypothetical protein